MIRKFSERFQGLINEEVPRKFLKSQESRNGHLDEGDYGRMLDNYDEKFPVPEDGFIAHYCKEN
jgi:hypothetical protein|nr:hypothetical protein [uncultured Acetatifactor sp.]